MAVARRPWIKYGRGPVKGVNSDMTWFIPAVEQDREIVLLNNAKVEWARCSIEWPNVEWASNTYAWTDMDAAIARLVAAGIAVLIMVNNTPAWARGGTGLPTNPPTLTQDYADFMGVMADHYKTLHPTGRFAYQVWNEPNTTRFWTSSAATYVDMLGKSYTAIKAVDSTLPVVFGGAALMASNWLTWIEDCYTAGLKGKYDIMGVQIYTTGGAIDTMWLRYRDIRTEQVTQADLKPMWITEWGWNTSTQVFDPVDFDPWQTGVSEAMQAQRVTEALAKMREDRDYLTHQFIYQFRNNYTAGADVDTVEGQLGLMKTTALSADTPPAGSLKTAYTTFSNHVR